MTVYRKMPNTGLDNQRQRPQALIERIDAYQVRFGTSKGIVDSIAGIWNASPTLRNALMMSTSSTDTWPIYG